MKKSPPKIPNLFEELYNLENNVNISNNKTFGILNIKKVSNVFYNHLMIINNSKFPDDKNKCFKASITQRNKSKTLTILYYAPKT